MIKHIVRLLTSALALLMLVGCSCENNDKTLNELIEFKSVENEKYNVMEIHYKDQVYRPFCAAEPSQADKLIGYYLDDEGYQCSVYSLKGAKSDEWVVEVMDGIDEKVNGENCGFISKEVHTKKIPKGLKVEPEYKAWN